MLLQEASEIHSHHAHCPLSTAIAWLDPELGLAACSAGCRLVPAFPITRSPSRPIWPGLKDTQEIACAPRTRPPDRPGPALQQDSRNSCFRCFPSNGRDVHQIHEVPIKSKPQMPHLGRMKALPPLSGLRQNEGW